MKKLKIIFIIIVVIGILIFILPLKSSEEKLENSILDSQNEYQVKTTYYNIFNIKLFENSKVRSNK